MFKDILTISGKSGLYKLVSRGKNMLIVESLLDGKRIPAYTTEKVVSLTDIAIFTQEGDLKLNEVLKKLLAKENSAPCPLDPKSDNEALKAYMGELLPTYDRDRVYPTDIRKLIIWYNILVKAEMTDFEVETAEETAEKTDMVTETKEKEKPQKAAAKTASGIQAKKMQTTKQTRTKV